MRPSWPRSAATPLASLVLLCLACPRLFADSAGAFERRVYNTQHCGAGAPTIDGIIDDECWNQVEWGGDFTQWDPKAGDPPTEQTAFKVLYDDDALYLAYRAYDSQPNRIESQLARRDYFPGDWVEVNIDSYHDQRTAFSFTSSVSGTRGDEFISSDGDDWDGNWDPVWQLATHVDDEGWTAEVMIPLSQLRFSGADEQVWGLQVQRRLFRENERSLWQPKSKDDSGWVSRFGELHGIRGLKAGRQIELLPYAVAKGERFEAVPGDPFLDGNSGSANAGLDGKIGVTNDLTLDFTINPDFGQVEADPSEVNLTAFETFFSERRPFFIEGNNILDFQIAPSIAGGGFTSDNLFYSRRIGGRPHWSPDLVDGEFADLPDNSSIIAALKVTGKTQSGVSVGILESVTARESATIAASGDVPGSAGTPLDLVHGERRKETVEPLTNFFVGRLQKDFDAGNTLLGGMFTATNRQILRSHLHFLHTAAYSGGIDFLHQWQNKAWYFAMNAVGSRVEGHPSAIDETQTSSARYYQRPDNDYVTYDPNRTSLTGYGGSLRLGRVTGAGLRFETGAAARSPGFEINDAGFMRRADEINQFTWVGWASRDPFAVFRRVGVNANQWIDWDFGGTRLREAVNTNFNMNFTNSWAAGAGITRTFERVSNTALRGGPSMLWPGETYGWFWINSDNRKRIRLDFGGEFGSGDENHFDSQYWWLWNAYRVSNAFQFTLSPWYSTSRQELQYVTEAEAGDEPRYVFGSIDRQTFALTLRMDYTLTPNLTLQFYGQPFVAAGDYTTFKNVDAPRAPAYLDRFHTYTDNEIGVNEETGEYEVTESSGTTYSFGNPNFNVTDFNSNLVLRWEYRPGSTIFLVWQQARSSFVETGAFHVRNDLDALFNTHPHNVFLVKINRWFSL